MLSIFLRGKALPSVTSTNVFFLVIRRRIVINLMWRRLLKLFSLDDLYA